MAILIAPGLVKHDADLMAPVTIMLSVLAVLVYLPPTALAMYRDCKASVWIAVVNVFLG